MSEGAYAVELRWRPIHTPARSAWLLALLAGSLALGLVLLGWGPLSRKA